MGSRVYGTYDILQNAVVDADAGTKGDRVTGIIADSGDMQITVADGAALTGNSSNTTIYVIMSSLFGREFHHPFMLR